MVWGPARGREPLAVNTQKTVLVLTPILGGFYFGDLLASLTRTVSAAGGRLVIAKTLHQAPSDDSQSPGDFAIPVAWSQVDGVVSIHSAVEAPYLLKLREAGRPVVLLGGLTADIDAPAVMPDNHSGTIAAVEHLIGHGHTRIGFVGNLSHSDIKDRFNAYVLALEAHGLDHDPAFVLDVSDNMEAGGREAAYELLTRTHRPTALMIATVRNALGLMSVLKHAGMTLPEDLAIVAFDNIEAAAFSIPSLTSTSQSFDELGSLAGHLILAAIRGEVVPRAVFTPKAADLKVRTSCGCATGAGVRDNLPTSKRSILTPDRGAGEARDILAAALIDADEILNEPDRDAELEAIGYARKLLLCGEPITDSHIRSLIIALRQLASRPDRVQRLIDAVLEYLAGVDVPDVDHKVKSRITVALWRVKAGEFLHQLESKELAFYEQYVVDAGMLDSQRNQPHTLRWLAGTHVKAGALGLWAGDPANGIVEIVGTFAPGRDLPDFVGTHGPVETFPPTAILDLLVAEDRDICVVVPVRTATRDWGLLAIVGAVGAAAMRETYRHWAGMLGAALESQRLQEEVRRSALYDALTGLPNRRLFLEKLGTAVNRRVRFGTPFAVLFLDLDGFKLINDTRGHQAGDKLLEAVGARIQRDLRAVDTGSRFGGDEFAILLEDTDADGALLVAQRVQASLNAPIEVDGTDVSIRASLGIAVGSAKYSSGEEILRDADVAMYRAKAMNTGSIAFFEEAPNTPA